VTVDCDLTGVRVGLTRKEARELRAQLELATGTWPFDRLADLTRDTVLGRLWAALGGGTRER